MSFKKDQISLLSIPKILASSIARTFLAVYKFFKTERKLLLVTKSKIVTINLGFFIQASTFCIIPLVTFLIINSFSSYQTIIEKSIKISKLKSLNNKFGKEVSDVNTKLEKINEYLLSTTGAKSKEINKNAETYNFQIPNNLIEDDLSDSDVKAINDIESANEKISKAQLLAIKRIEHVAGLSNKIPKTPESNLYSSTSKKAIIANYKKVLENKYGQGGPFLDDDVLFDGENLLQEDLVKHLENIKFSGKFDYLITLENLAKVLPFGKPMENYYLSSGFGRRVDPINRTKAVHRGLDFVGVPNAKIYSPSKGKVVLAGKFYEYGNAIVIDHGFGVTTRYGHLSAIKVKKGQIVKKGELIALQGTTGRSTGPHLHYEVRYKKLPLDPENFLKAGEVLSKPAKINANI